MEEQRTPTKKPVSAYSKVMGKLASAMRILTIPLVIVFYLAVLYYNLHESDRRSLTLKHDIPATTDAVHVSLNIVNLDVARGEITARMRIRLTGKIAKDEFTPAVNLQFLVNAFQGQQRFELERGERVRPFTVTFHLAGEQNLYPFDTYEALLAFVATKPGQEAKPAPTPEPAPSSASASAAGQSTSILEQLKKAVAGETEEPPAGQVKLVGESELASRTQVPVLFDLSASIPGFKFDGEIVATGQEQMTGIQLKLRRANNVIVASLGIQLIMLLLALSMLAMVLFGTMKGKGAAIDPLYIAPVLIFGLPALRDTQPGVPPLGAFSDYLSYMWAEWIVAACTIISIWTWISRHRSDNEATASEPEPVDEEKTSRNG